MPQRILLRKSPKNALTDEGIAAISNAFQRWHPREKLSRVITLEQVREADYNLSPSLFVDVNDKMNHRPLIRILAGLGLSSFRTRKGRRRIGDSARSAPTTLRIVMTTHHSDWEKVTLQRCCFRPEYGYTASASEKPIGPKFLRITDIQNGGVDWRKVP